MDYRWNVLKSFYAKSCKDTKYTVEKHKEIFNKAGWNVKTN